MMPQPPRRLFGWLSVIGAIAWMIFGIDPPGRGLAQGIGAGLALYVVLILLWEKHEDDKVDAYLRVKRRQQMYRDLEDD